MAGKDRGPGSLWVAAAILPRQDNGRPLAKQWSKNRVRILRFHPAILGSEPGLVLLPGKDKPAWAKPFEDLGDHFIVDRKATLASSDAALRGREGFTHLACRMDHDPTALSHVVLGIETFEPTGQAVFANVDLTRNKGAARRGVGVGLVRQPLHPQRLCKIDYPNPHRGWLCGKRAYRERPSLEATAEADADRAWPWDMLQQPAQAGLPSRPGARERPAPPQRFPRPQGSVADCLVLLRLPCPYWRGSKLTLSFCCIFLSRSI